MDGSIRPDIDPQSPTLPPKKKRFVLGCLGIALGLFLAFFYAWTWSYGMMGAGGWGDSAGSTLLPALIAYAIAGRKSVRDFNRYGLWFSGLSLAFFLISGRTPVSLQQHIANLMKEAAGTKTVDDIGHPVLDDLIGDMMRSILDDRKSFDRETEPFSPELSKLYSIDTFSSPEAMQKSIDAVRGVVAADERYSDKVDSIPDRMQASVDRSSLSNSDKREFMEGVRKSYGNVKTLQIRRQAMVTEEKWQVATVGLYEFAMAHATTLRRDGTKLRIEDQKVRSEFNERLDQAQKLRADLVTQNKQLESAQRAALQQAGLTLNDLGLGESDPQPRK
jgi:hypothetical protein